jgi:hypothetical protein
VFISISYVTSWQSHDAGSVGVGNFDFQMIIALSSGDYSGSVMVVSPCRTPLRRFFGRLRAPRNSITRTDRR